MKKKLFCLSVIFIMIVCTFAVGCIHDSNNNDPSINTNIGTNKPIYTVEQIEKKVQEITSKPDYAQTWEADALVGTHKGPYKFNDASYYRDPVDQSYQVYDMSFNCKFALSGSKSYTRSIGADIKNVDDVSINGNVITMISYFGPTDTYGVFYVVLDQTKSPIALVYDYEAFVIYVDTPTYEEIKANINLAKDYYAKTK